MEEMITPYELPEVENHSFFFIDQRIETHVEAKLHQHDAWELYMCYMDTEPEWQAIRYSLFRLVMWH